MSRTDPQMKIRLPPDLHAYMKRRAWRERRSMNSEIILLILREMEKEKAPGSRQANPDASHAE
ncbi:Arc family DNA-binding protein [Acetobacter papayae]|uniref:Arc family DNA-binding protein n=1 Tax=Acetobacter papayae TaxID=1076592 RepID=UPI0039E8F432